MPTQTPNWNLSKPLVNNATDQDLWGNELNGDLDIIDGAIAPIGTLFMWLSATAPTGYFECNGSAISRTTYPSLFSILGTTFGSGDGTTTFNIPDMRGYFPRGWANTGTIDPARVFGSTQVDAIASHAVTITDPGHFHDLNNEAYPGVTAIGGTNYIGDSNGSAGTPVATNVDPTGITAAYTGAIETRPINVAIMFIIKAG